MVIEKINLDLSLKMLPVTVKAKQGDRESRHIEASLFYNNLNYNVPPSATVLISYSKPDKKKVENTIEKENVIGNRVTFPLTEQMLTVAGIANCDVKILNGNGIISTATFKVHVEPQAVPDGAVKSTDEYNALVNALVDVKNLETSYAPRLNDVERKIDSNTQAFNDAVANITVDSEIITARSSGVKGKTFSVLDERLEEAEQDFNSLKEDYANYQNDNNLKIATIEKSLNDYKSTMASVNVNQEAKQSATGYGVVSLPKNAANGQISVSVKGNTETDEEGNTKSTVSASRIRSVSEDETQESTQYLPNVGELRSLPNGTKDEIRVSGGKAELIKRVSDEFIFSQLNWTVYSLGESADFYAAQTVEVPVPNGYLLNQFNIVNYPSLYTGDLATFQTTNSFIFRTHENNLRIKIPKSEISGTVDNAKIKAWFQSKGVRLTYQLAEPIITPINASGNIVSNPSGTVYIEPVVADAGMYTTKLNVLNTDLPINYIEKLSKVDFNTGVETELDSSKCVIAEDKLSFTHPDLTANDIVFFTYYHNLETTQGETTIEYYDSRHTLKDSVTGKFYKVVPAVANGVLVNELVEV